MAGRRPSSWVWKTNSGVFVTTNAPEGKAKCEFVLDDGTLCGHLLNVNTGNMAYHLEVAHEYTEAKWAEKRAEGIREGLASFLIP
jgi:hypothetical protein